MAKTLRVPKRAMTPRITPTAAPAAVRLFRKMLGEPTIPTMPRMRTVQAGAETMRGPGVCGGGVRVAPWSSRVVSCLGKVVARIVGVREFVTPRSGGQDFKRAPGDYPGGWRAFFGGGIGLTGQGRWLLLS